ncbi:MAG: hypothetical protein GF331_25555 [Chitinivibrionales bacterium]|nr:hypothetical protein [Chitinivibrionales bacterium]
MKSRMVTTIGIALCMAFAAPAMEIRNHCEEEGGIRTESGTFEEDFLFLGHALNFSGEAEDLVFLGKELTFSGKTNLTLYALGERLVFTGASGNGIMAGCGDIAVDGLVDGNSYMGCKSLHLSERAVVNGNLFVGCAKLAIDGAVNGNLYAGTGELIVNSVIDGDVVAYGGRVIIGEEGRINGNLTYSAKEELSEEELARVGGTVEVTEGFEWDKDNVFPKRFAKWLQVVIGIAFFVSFVVVGNLLLFIPAFRRLDGEQSGRGFWTTALWGLIPVLMYPGIVVLSLALVVTIPFAFVLMLALVPLLFLAHLVGTTLLGKYLAMKFKWNIRKRHYQFLIGVLVAGIVSMIPFVNFLGFVLITSLGFGAYLSFLFGRDLSAAQ